MTDPPLTTMAPPEAAAPPNVNQASRAAPSNTPARSTTKNFETREHDLTIRAFFPLPPAPTKFHPISAMTQLLRIMLKEEPSLVLRTATNDQQRVLASDSLPTGEKAFKQFFTVSTPRAERQKVQHVCIGCHLLSARTLGNIKFHSPESQLLTWLKKEKVFLESDNLGTDRPVTVGYFTKIDPLLTHLANFREYLANQLLLIDIDVDTAIELAPYLKQVQLDAMSNGDEFVTILPPFELYKTRLTHGREPSQISTEVIGIKGAPKDAKLLGEFFTRLASEVTNDTRDGVYLPNGAANLIGPATYAQVLQDNNFFLNNVATIPVNLEYAAWFAVIDPENHSDDAPITLHDHLIRKTWFLRLESVTRHKCLLVTTKSNLNEARQWLDDNLEPLIRKSIPADIDPPASFLPRRLDKPVYTTTSQTYADILKKKFSLQTTPQIQTETNNRPPRKRPAKILDYDSDQSTEYPPLACPTVSASSSTPNPPASTQQPPATTPPEYAKDLASLKHEISQLKEIITTAVTQIKQAFESFPVTPCHNEPSAMDTTTTTGDNPKPLELPEIIRDLKNDIAAISNETRDMIQRCLPQRTKRNHSSMEITPEISVLIDKLKHDIANVTMEMRAKFQQHAILTANHQPQQPSGT